jgi:hypothetical protein
MHLNSCFLVRGVTKSVICLAGWTCQLPGASAIEIYKAAWHRAIAVPAQC